MRSDSAGRRFVPEGARPVPVAARE